MSQRSRSKSRPTPTHPNLDGGPDPSARRAPENREPATEPKPRTGREIRDSRRRKPEIQSKFRSERGRGEGVERTLDGGVGGVGEDGAAEDAHHVADPHGEARLALSPLLVLLAAARGESPSGSMRSDASASPSVFRWPTDDRLSGPEGAYAVGSAVSSIQHHTKLNVAFFFENEKD